MKKKILTGIAIAFVLSVLLSFCIVFAGAEQNATDTAPESAIWKITHTDGSVEYSDTFNGAFAKIADGDTFKLLPTEYNVYLANYATIRPTSKVNITIDLRGTTIIAPETGDVDGQIFNISDSNKGSTVNVLMENARIFAAPGGRCAFSVGGYTVINIDGGKDGGIIHAGGALNLTANYADEATYSTVKNMFCYKSTQNMAGMLCSRNTSKLKLIDTYAVGDAACKGTLPLYVRNSGCMILENSHGISLNDSNVLEFVEATSETSFTLSRGSTLHGIVKGVSNSNLMKIASGTHLGSNYSATLLGDSYLSDNSLEITHTVYTSSAVGEETASQVTLSYPYSVCENIILEDVETASSIWKLEGAGITKYSSSLSALASAEYSKATLLRDTELSEAIVIELTSALEIDFAGKKLSLKSGADVGFAFIVEGSGELKLSLGSSEINFLGAGFLRANNSGNVKITSSGMLAADILVSKTLSSGILSVEGGAYLSRLGDGFVCAGAVSLKNLSVTSDASGSLVSSSDNITVESSSLIAAKGSYAISCEKDLTLLSENYICGKVTVRDMLVGDYSYFDTMPNYESVETTIISELVECQITLLSVSDGVIKTEQKGISFTYYTKQYILSDTKQENSVWELKDKNGTVKYTDHIYTPLIDLSKYVNYTLLCDLKLPKEFSLALVGDITIDLGSNKISIDTKYDIERPLFDISGDGVVEFHANGAVIDAANVTVFHASKIKGISLSLENSFINANTAVLTEETPIVATGGYYYAKNGAFVSVGGTVELSALSAYSNTGAAVIDTNMDVTVKDGAELVGENESRVIRTDARLMVADGVDIFGAVAAKDLYSAGKIRFTLKPSVEYSNMLVVQERENKEIVLKTMTDGKISEKKTKFVLSYITVNITDDLKVSLNLSSYATLNVYVPTSIVNSDTNFTVRIVLSGLLYEAKAQAGTSKTIDGKSFVRFSYPYVYPDAYAEEAKITLISGNFNAVKTIGISDYFERSMDLTASDEMRAVIASYAAYSAECSGVKLAEDSLISKHAKKLKIYSEAESELLFDYFRSVRYEPSANELRFTPWTSCDYTLNVTYKFGESDMSYTFSSKDGAFAIPIYRFAMADDFVMTFADSNGEKTLNINLYELAYFAEEGSDTRMLLTLYLAYANALSVCVGG